MTKSYRLTKLDKAALRAVDRTHERPLAYSRREVTDRLPRLAKLGLVEERDDKGKRGGFRDIGWFLTRPGAAELVRLGQSHRGYRINFEERQEALRKTRPAKVERGPDALMDLFTVPRRGRK